MLKWDGPIHSPKCSKLVVAPPKSQGGHINGETGEGWKWEYANEEVICINAQTLWFAHLIAFPSHPCSQNPAVTRFLPCIPCFLPGTSVGVTTYRPLAHGAATGKVLFILQKGHKQGLSLVSLDDMWGRVPRCISSHMAPWREAALTCCVYLGPWRHGELSVLPWASLSPDFLFFTSTSQSLVLLARLVSPAHCRADHESPSPVPGVREEGAQFRFTVKETGSESQGTSHGALNLKGAIAQGGQWRPKSHPEQSCSN